MLKEFQEFAMKGNVVDMAIGVIGGPFGKIVSSLVEDVIMPPIGLALGKVDFANLFFNLSGRDYPSVADAIAVGAPTLNYGIFFNTVFNFLIIAFTIFLVVRQFNAAKQREPAPGPSSKNCPYCLSPIPIKATRCAHCTSELN